MNVEKYQCHRHLKINNSASEYICQGHTVQLFNQMSHHELLGKKEKEFKVFIYFVLNLIGSSVANVSNQTNKHMQFISLTRWWMYFISVSGSIKKGKEDVFPRQKVLS